MNEKFLYTEDNIKIAINHYECNCDSVVIVCPGWFMTKDSKAFKNLSEDFNKNYDVITMDFRGHGKSGGFFTFTAKELLDLNAVVNYAKNECGYKNIYLLGFSLGGALVLLCGAECSLVDKIIAVSAPTNFMKIENLMFMPQAWIPTLLQKFEPKRWLTIRAGFPFFKKIKPIDIVSKLTVPTLFIAGEKDPTVFPWHTEALYNKTVCKKQYKLFKNGNHAEDLYHDFPEEFLNLCFEWLENS